MDPVIITAGIALIRELIKSGALTKADIDQIEESIKERKELVAEWDSLAPEDPA